MTDDADYDEEEFRGRITIYAPAHLVNEWKREADLVDMTMSRWCRLRLEAGRREVAVLDPLKTSDESGDSGLREDVIQAIPKDEGATTDEVIQTVLGLVETRIKEHLKELDEQGSISHDPVKGGYVRK
jgi:hypothetical protein